MSEPLPGAWRLVESGQVVGLAAQQEAVGVAAAGALGDGLEVADDVAAFVGAERGSGGHRSPAAGRWLDAAEDVGNFSRRPARRSGWSAGG
jgi:hypothetical protein